MDDGRWKMDDVIPSRRKMDDGRWKMDDVIPPRRKMDDGRWKMDDVTSHRQAHSTFYICVLTPLLVLLRLHICY